MKDEEIGRLNKTLSQNPEKKYYVYMLLNEDDRPFYIGKGAETRVFQHEWKVWKFESTNKKQIENDKEEIEYQDISDKFKEIHRMKKKGIPVKKVIVKWGLTENEAYMCESALINMYNFLNSENPLTNIVNGHASEPEGHSSKARTVEDFLDQVAIEGKSFEALLKEKNIGEELLRNNKKIVFFTINDALRKFNCKHDYDNFVYDASRGCWNMGIRNDHPADYVIALHRQVIVGVFKVKKWYRVYEFDEQNFPVYPKGGREHDVECIKKSLKDPEVFELTKNHERGKLKKKGHNFLNRFYYVKDEDDHIVKAIKGDHPVLLLDPLFKSQSHNYWPFRNSKDNLPQNEEGES